jgi:hypothetical protein
MTKFKSEQIVSVEELIANEFEFRHFYGNCEVFARNHDRLMWDRKQQKIIQVYTDKERYSTN